MIILLMRNQRANADNRVVDVLWKFGANFVFGFAVVTIRRSEACEVGHRFNIPYEQVWHVTRLVYCRIERFHAAAALRSDIEKFQTPESNLCESPRSQVPYFCYLLSLPRSPTATGVAMRMTAPKRRSSFGTNCVRCDSELIAPERSEYHDDGQIRHFWQCSRCDCSFEVVPPTHTKSIEDIMRRIEDIMRRRGACPLRLVA